MKTTFIKLIPMVAFCAIALGSCTECCSYLNSDSMEVRVCRNDATEHDWAEYRHDCIDDRPTCICD